MTLSDLSIKKPVFAWMIMFGLIVFGAISLGRLGISQMPDVDFPILEINVTWEGAAPEVMESEIADKIEQAVISVEGIRDITTSVRQGSARVVLEFELNRDVDVALQEVQSYISRVRLPLNVDPPRVFKSNPDDQPIIFVGISSTRSLHDLIVYVDQYLQDQFQIIPGVGEITINGFSERNLRIWMDLEKLRQYDLTVLDLERAIELEHTEIAAGYIENTKQEMNIRMMGEGLTPEEVENILITQRGGRPIYHTKIRIKDVARVEDSLNDVRRISRINGVPGISLSIKKQRGANTVEVARLVRAKIDDLNKQLPKDLQLGVNFDSTKFIEESIQETEFTLILSAIITGMVCWLFLGNWSSTFNVLLSIPTSVIGTFIVLYFMNFTLNLFTLLGLSLAIGIIVDDAIMVLENIVRHAEMGKNQVQASRDGAREITFAAVATSIAVMAIFLPVIFMKGVIGKFFFQFGVTISTSIALSLLEAITLTPMRCSRFLELSKSSKGMTQRVDHYFNRLSQFYSRSLKPCVQRPGFIIMISFLFCILSWASIFKLRQELIPPGDMSTFILRYQTPVGSSLQFTSEQILEAEKILKTRPEITRYFTTVGGSLGGDSSTARTFITLVPPHQRTLSQQELMNWCRKEISKVKGIKKVIPEDLSMRGFNSGGGAAVNFNIRGGDYKVLKVKSAEIIKRLEATGLYRDLDTDYREGMPEIRVIPDRELAARCGATMESIGRTVQAAMGGVRQGKFSNDGHRYDVRLRLEPEERLQAKDMENLLVRTTYGETVELKNLAHIETGLTLQTITRRMRERSITITANVASGKSQGEALRVVEQISKEVLPKGYRVFLSGSSQSFKESTSSLLFAFTLGVLVAYMVLASQFNSFIHPLSVLLALPFGVSGAFLALLIGQQSLNLYSIIGIILLAGIVKKNSILLVEFANQRRSQDNLNAKDAMLKAAPIRLRPILMTSLATLAAALPPALALGPGAESRIPMAITIIGGVLVSTIFTLVVVPCAYILLSRFETQKQNL